MKSLNLDLFDELNDQPAYVIRKDGDVNYYNEVLARGEADKYLHTLLNKITWRNDEVNLFGKQIITRRKVAWYAEKPYRYTYSNSTKQALPWTRELIALKSLVEEKSGETFNCCLLNLYHDGTEAMAWHSDAEKELKQSGAIGSLSFGAERKFSFKHKKTNEVISLILHHGSLLVMKGVTQKHWLHCLRPTKTITQPRVNLTFRTIENTF